MIKNALKTSKKELKNDLKTSQTSKNELKTSSNMLKSY